MKLTTYQWIGLMNSIKTHGELRAYSINLAKLFLKEQGILVLSIRKKLFPFLSQRKMTSQEILFFLKKLATLLQAGIPIVSACETLLKSEEHPILIQMLHTIKRHLKSGQLLSQILKNFPVYFDTLTCQLIQIGEQSGKLDIVLMQIAETRMKLANLKQQLWQASLYPVLIFIISISVTLFMLLGVVPHFADLFSSLAGNLPVATAGIIFLSEFIRRYYALEIMMILFLSIIGFYYKKSFLPFLDQFIFKIPFLKSLYQKIICLRFIKTFALTFESGIPLTEAIRLSTQVVGSKRYQDALIQVWQSVNGGRLLYQSLKKPLFPNLMISMIQVGEESGQLESMLKKISDLYENEINDTLIRMGKLLEPLIIAILGVLIGGVVIAMYLPIFKLGTVI